MRTTTTSQTWQTGNAIRLHFLSLLFAAIFLQSNAFQQQTVYQEFIFAPNDVCIAPQYFVDSSSQQVFTMRNVPGEGDCMFLAAALATAASMGLGASHVLPRKIAKETRQVVADVLEFGNNRNLVIDSKRSVRARQLLLTASKEEGLTPEEYLRRLRLEGSEGGLHGGGPELTVLSNVLRRPISVYELLPTVVTAKKYHPVECKGVFGDKTFKDPCLTVENSAILSNDRTHGAYSWHLNILVLDSSTKGEKHACVLLPQSLKS